MMELIKQNGIMRGRDIIRRAIINPYVDLIVVDLPVEYVSYCTNNFESENQLGQGGSGDVFLAIDRDDPQIEYVAKRLPVEYLETQKADLFRRELEVNKVILLMMKKFFIQLYSLFFLRIRISTYS